MKKRDKKIQIQLRIWKIEKGLLPLMKNLLGIVLKEILRQTKNYKKNVKLKKKLTQNTSTLIEIIETFKFTGDLVDVLTIENPNFLVNWILTLVLKQDEYLEDLYFLKVLEKIPKNLTILESSFITLNLMEI